MGGSISRWTFAWMLESMGIYEKTGLRVGRARLCTDCGLGGVTLARKKWASTP